VRPLISPVTRPSDSGRAAGDVSAGDVSG
jgi:hypothetical protein